MPIPRFSVVGSSLVDLIVCGVKRLPYDTHEEVVDASGGIHLCAGGSGLNLACQLGNLNHATRARPNSGVEFISKIPNLDIITHALNSSNVTFDLSMLVESPAVAHCVCINNCGPKVPHPSRWFFLNYPNILQLDRNTLLKADDTHPQRLHLAELGGHQVYVDEGPNLIKRLRNRPGGCTVTASTVSRCDALASPAEQMKLGKVLQELDWLFVNLQEAYWLLNGDEEYIHPIGSGNTLQQTSKRAAEAVLDEAVDSARELHKRYAMRGGVVVTCGHFGSTAFFCRSEFRASSQPATSAVDPVGAGDAYCAAFLDSIVDDESIDNALRRGNYFASKMLERHGGSVYFMDRNALHSAVR